jgi:hypothetical protein
MNEPLTEAELIEIEARAAGAIAGPWTIRRMERADAGPAVAIEANGADRTVVDVEAGEGTLDEREAQFIAHAREDVPRLIAEVRRLRAGVQRSEPIEGARVWLRPWGNDSEPVEGDLSDSDLITGFRRLDGTGAWGGNVYHLAPDAIAMLREGRKPYRPINASPAREDYEAQRETVKAGAAGVLARILAEDAPR